MAPTKETTTKDAPVAVVDTAAGAEGTDVVGPTEHGYITDKARYLTRLRRTEGQVRGIHRMVDEEQYCIDILTQVSALNKALESVALGLLNDHLKHCLIDAAAEGGPVAEAKLKEVCDAIARLVRS
jgi:DNA-binding FrmR family transcriptional regulator